MNNRERDGKKKNSGAGWIIAAIVVFLFNTIGESGDISRRRSCSRSDDCFHYCGNHLCGLCRDKGRKKICRGFYIGFFLREKTRGIRRGTDKGFLYPGGEKP